MVSARRRAGNDHRPINLGLIYANGLVPVDLVQAHKWLTLSATQGAQEAARNREIVERHMTAEQIAKARQLAKEWEPKE
jgi:TPR repeat protein